MLSGLLWKHRYHFNNQSAVTIAIQKNPEIEEKENQILVHRFFPLFNKYVTVTPVDELTFFKYHHN